MVNRGLAKHQPSEYKVGEDVHVIVQGKGIRRKRRHSVKAPKVFKGKIVAAKYEQFKYKIRYKTDNDKVIHIWFHVNNGASLARSEEYQRRAKIKLCNIKNKSKCNCPMCHEVFDDKWVIRWQQSAAYIYHITTKVLKDFLTRIAML